jgi:hypothetical protein
MTEIEQLRKELNELRERIAVLEKRPIHAPLDLSSLRQTNPLTYQTQPRFVGQQGIPLGTITCNGGGSGG